MLKRKLLVVGSFPKENSNIYGGIARSCQVLSQSPELTNFDIIEFDSSQIADPPPGIVTRSYFASKRLIQFPFLLFFKKPSICLIFCSAGLSALEKGVMVLISKVFNIPVLIFPRAGKLIAQTNKSTIFLKVIKTLFKNADYFLCQGDKWKSFAIEKLEFNNKKVTIINNWTATDDLIKLGGVRNKFSSFDKMRLIYIGWVSREKGIIELLDSIKNLKNKGYNINLSVLGDGKILEYSKKFVIDNGITDNVSFKGWVSRAEMKKYLNDSDIFVLPSWEEGMPNSLIEALASGLPSIVTDVGVISNYVINNKHALVVKPKDINDLQNSIEKLILDSKLRKKLSKNGYLLAKDVFLTNDSLKKLSAILNQLVIS